MLFIQLFTPAVALVLGLGALALVAARRRPRSTLTSATRLDLPGWSWLRVLLTPSGHAFVLPRLDAPVGALGPRAPEA